MKTPKKKPTKLSPFMPPYESTMKDAKEDKKGAKAPKKKVKK